MNLQDIPNTYTLGGSDVKLDNESYMKGFEGRGSASNSSNSANIEVNLGSTEISQIEIFYFSTDDAQSDPSKQTIGISDLTWDTPSN